ncbi:MAG: BTAD domain-containing putative transcriptional regulator, partial [Anaerolineae bacterium]
MNVAGNPALETHPVQADSSASPSARLVMSLLGPPQVMVHGESVIGPESQKKLALLAYLALEAHRPHLRSALAALFWPDRPEKQALQDLRQTLARVRRAIDDREANPAHLITDSQTIQFNPHSDYWLDVAAFQRLLASTQRHPHRRLDACPTCVSHLSQASELYRGDFLAEVYVSGSSAFDEWLSIQREQLRLQACTALQALAGAYLARGSAERAAHYARRLLYLDPWNEAVHRLLLRALALSEGRSAALWHFETLRQVLAEELRVEPEDATLALVQQICAGTLQDAQPRAATAHLPTPATPFVGRDRERKQISDYLASRDQRLITLYGPGGSGKTRLALEIAAEQAPLWQAGVWFVPLAGVPAADQLVEALAIALELGTTDGPVKPEQLIDFLRPKESLLILDSFEHLVAPPQSPPISGGREGGAGLLRDILRWAPEVRLLVTSRARLGVRGEWAVRLDGLDVPPGPHPSPAQVEGASAVRLFVNSARRVKPDFALSPERLPAVVRICQLVAGLPLGIELAAAWVRMFSCQRIADEIERSPDFLSNPGGGNPGRQHSLRATFEYSYSLLSEREQALFRKLSVFRGGFTAEAAQQVADAGPSGLASLLDKSLLQTSPSRRLGVHLTLQEYATEKLMAMPEEERWARERHCRVYLPFVQEREEALTGERSKEALEEIDVDLGNVRAAWRWALAQGKIREIKAGIDGLARFYDLRGLYREAEAAFGSAADSMLAPAQGELEAQRVACRLLLEQARFLLLQALHARAIQVAQAAIDLAQTVQEQTWEARGVFLWGDALFRQGDYEMARLQLERALALVQATGDGAAQELTPAARETEPPGLGPER